MVPEHECPACKAAMRPGTILCIECGYHIELGKKIGSAAVSEGEKQDNPEGDDEPSKMYPCPACGSLRSSNTMDCFVCGWKRGVVLFRDGDELAATKLTQLVDVHRLPLGDREPAIAAAKRAAEWLAGGCSVSMIQDRLEADGIDQTLVREIVGNLEVVSWQTRLVTRRAGMRNSLIGGGLVGVGIVLMIDFGVSGDLSLAVWFGGLILTGLIFTWRGLRQIRSGKLTRR